MAEVVADDLELEVRWLHEPIGPCDLLPNGAPGLLLVTAGGVARTYAVAILGRYWKREKRAEFHGYRVLTDKGEVHDIDPNAEGGPTCSCGDATHRARFRGCRHVAALRRAGEPIPMPVRHDQATPPAEQPVEVTA